MALVDESFDDPYDLFEGFTTWQGAFETVKDYVDPPEQWPELLAASIAIIASASPCYVSGVLKVRDAR